MSDRTLSEKIWADLESRLSSMDHAQLVRICAHLIRTYVVEGHSPAVSAPAPMETAPQPTREERAAPARPSASPPFGGSTPAPKPVAEEPPREKPKKKDSGYNKLEMD